MPAAGANGTIWLWQKGREKSIIWVTKGSKAIRGTVKSWRNRERVGRCAPLSASFMLSRRNRRAKKSRRNGRMNARCECWCNRLRRKKIVKNTQIISRSWRLNWGNRNQSRWQYLRIEFQQSKYQKCRLQKLQRCPKTRWQKWERWYWHWQVK